MNLVIFTDGASRGNPGHAAIGYLITDGKNELESGGEYIGVTTNNEAEYRALIKALDEAKKYKPEEITCYSDSKLMINQLKGEWKIKAPQLMDYFNDVMRIKGDIKIKFRHVRRTNPGIQRCDLLANEAIDGHFYSQNK